MTALGLETPDNELPGVGGHVSVISLVPSVTETVISWGIRPVAITRFCEQDGYETVGGTKNPDIDRIEQLAPDLVLLDREENRKEDAEELSRRGVRLHATDVTSVEDVEPALLSIRRALGLPGKVPGWSRQDVATGGGTALRAWVPIWRRPWMSINGDTYGSSVLKSCGVENVLAGEPLRYPTVSLEQVADLGPDVVLAPTEPYSFQERHLSELAAVAPVVEVDGKDLFWWGTRTPAAIARIFGLVSGLAAGGMEGDD